MPINARHLTCLSIPKLDLLCYQYLAAVYQKSSDAIASLRVDKNNIAETYGEILFPSVQKLLHHLALQDDDVFVDLGAGLGKVVLQFFLQSPIKAAFGIEINAGLYHHACVAAERVHAELPEFYVGDRRVQFILGDFLQMPLTMASVIFISSPCFGPRLLLDLVEIINKLPEVHTVISLKPLPPLHTLVFLQTLRIECSWDTTLCYIYRSQRSIK